MTVELETPADAETAEDRLKRLAERAMQLKVRADAAAEEAKEAEAALRAELKAQDKLNEDFKGISFVKASIYPTRQWNEELARKVVPADIQAQCEKPILDRAAVQRLISPAMYEQCQKVSGMTMKLSLASPSDL